MKLSHLAHLHRPHRGAAGQAFELAVSDAVNQQIPDVVDTLRLALRPSASKPRTAADGAARLGDSSLPSRRNRSVQSSRSSSPTAASCAPAPPGGHRRSPRRWRSWSQHSWTDMGGAENDGHAASSPAATRSWSPQERRAGQHEDQPLHHEVSHTWRDVPLWISAHTWRHTRPALEGHPHMVVKVDVPRATLRRSTSPWVTATGCALSPMRSSSSTRCWPASTRWLPIGPWRDGTPGCTRLHRPAGGHARLPDREVLAQTPRHPPTAGRPRRRQVGTHAVTVEAQVLKSPASPAATSNATRTRRGSSVAGTLPAHQPGSCGTAVPVARRNSSPAARAHLRSQTPAGRAARHQRPAIGSGGRLRSQSTCRVSDLYRYGPDLAGHGWFLDDGLDATDLFEKVGDEVGSG